MPNKIYPVDIGTSLNIESPNVGRSIGSGYKTPNLNLNPLISLQAKIAEKEYDARMKAIVNRDAAVEDIMNPFKGANDNSQYFGINGPLTKYHNTIANGVREKVSKVAEDFISSGKTDMLSVSKFKQLADQLRNDPNINRVVRESEFLKQFGESTKNKELHPIAKAALDGILNSEDGNNLDDKFKTLQNWAGYEIINTDADKDFQSISKLTMDEAKQNPDLGMIQVTETVIPSAALAHVKRKYEQNYRNDYALGSAATGDNALVPEGMSLEDYIQRRAEIDSKPYIDTVKKTLLSDPILNNKHDKEMEEIRRVNSLAFQKQKAADDAEAARIRDAANKALSDAKTKRTENMTADQIAMSKAKTARIKGEDDTLDEEDIKEGLARTPKGAGESDKAHEGRVKDEITKVYIPTSSEKLKEYTDELNNKINSGKVNNEGKIVNDKGEPIEDVTFNIKGINPKEQHSLIKEYTDEEDLLTDSSMLGLLDRQTIFNGITGVEYRGGKKVYTGEIITKNQNYYDQLPDYYKVNAKLELNDEEMKALEDKGVEFQDGVKYYKIPIEIYPETKGSSYTGERSMLGKIIAFESSNDGNPTNVPNAEGASSAFGHYQYIRNTFLNEFDSVRDKIKDMLPEGALEAIDQLPRNIKDSPESRKAYHNFMKNFPEVQEIVFKEAHEPALIKAVGELRKEGVGKDLTDGELAYIIHHQGTNDKVKEFLADATKGIDRKGADGRLKKIKEFIKEHKEYGLDISTLSGTGDDGIAFSAKEAGKMQPPSKEVEKLDKQATTEKPSAKPMTNPSKPKFKFVKPPQQ